ncbi:MAG: hypothetical protein ONB48_19115 [candidate division KSB1 bacterium]|nr:hypothetical protein [candidate division KSB1 bacterium]MDZ7287758.1 hypothetical protein [candidate division KSB1 bacterium]MDZ7299902.1 hypothetical protein [candidate division KSB1 bacterium]MDZ7308362.1 hypothetical protein [candidate division KSB1 bacterium]MDZ7350901.1 hypothetical protein [candidate division KSB1 bacterium]
MKVIDISDPARPQRVAALYLPETFAVRILISGNYAYIGSLGAIVSIVDISTPTSPFVKNTFRLSDDFVKNMAIYESYLYIKTEHPIAPIYIHDVSDLDNPRLARCSAPHLCNLARQYAGQLRNLLSRAHRQFVERHAKPQQ